MSATKSNERTFLLGASSSNLDSPLPPPPIPEHSVTNLHKFREAVGINSTLNGEEGDLESARKSAHGLYKEIISLQKWRSWQYQIVEGVYYSSLGGQVIIGAVLASLGPLSKIHTTSITVLGVVNASLAGILVILKGQGLPDRLRKDEYQMRIVQDFIEETETKLVISGEDFTDDELEKVVEQVFEKYHTARDTAEMNKPMSYAHQSETEIHRMGGNGNSAVRRTRFAGDADADGKGKAKFVID